MKELAAYSTAHFIVDFSCAFLLFYLCERNGIDESSALGLFSLYNLLAFGTEFIVGFPIDERRALSCACVGILSVLAALFIGAFAAFLLENGSERAFFSHLSIFCVVLAGLGNSFFHVGGGVDATSQKNGGKYWRGGVFLSTGALGIAFGGICGRFGTISFTSVSLTLVGAVVWIWLSAKNSSRFEAINVENLSNRLKKENFLNIRFANIVLIFAALFAVAARSFAGFLAPNLISVRTSGLELSALFFAFGAFFGKLIGGFCADWFGGRRVGVFATLIALPLLCWSESATAFWLGVAALNVSTAITLVSTVERCGRRPGFAFGLTTLALLVGYFAFDATANFEIGAATRILARTLLAATLAIGISSRKRTKRFLSETKVE